MLRLFLNHFNSYAGRYLGSARLCVVGILWTLLSLNASAQQPNANDVERLKREISELQSRLANTRQERSRMEQLLEETERNMLAAQARLQDVQARLATTRTELDQLRTRQGRLEDQQREQAGRLEGLLVSVYKSGQQTPLKALLAPESLAQGQRMMTFYQYFNAAQLAELQEYEQTLLALREVETNIQARQQDLEAQNQQVVAENNQLLASRNQRQQVLARLAQEATSQAEQLAKKEAERLQLEALLREVEAAIEDIAFGDDEQPFAERRGQMALPVEGNIRIRYRERNPSTGVVYDGLFIATQAGAPVRAVHYGRVVFADWLRGYGLLVIIDHGQGYLSLYGRNESLNSAVGDWVRAGQTIAQVGDSGGFEEPGLYFEIRHNGATTNPQQWVRR
ncbi:murein hydrolase activator EnvC family protein [Salinispirillum marinum]|uniref:Murein hydrolase activator EnvC family protein n=2 Tax=Saccharospirillaceae TaxID=255527 RepID=A0ABV8BCV1_9GAMM